MHAGFGLLEQEIGARKHDFSQNNYVFYYLMLLSGVAPSIENFNFYYQIFL